MCQYLVDQIQKQPNLELAFVWNRNISALFGKVEPDNILTNLLDFKDFGPDLIVEVAHPSVTHECGAAFLAAADFMIGSPTAMAAQETEAALRQAAQVHGLYVPSGAFWGGEDIKKMADRGTLQALKVTMKKHPTSFKLEGELAELNKSVMDNPVILYEGWKFTL